MQINVTLDCADPERLAEFWMPALDYEKKYDVGLREPYLVLSPKNRSSEAPLLCLQRVPEPKTNKLRMHFDLSEVDDIEGEMDRLIALGATRISDEVPYYEFRWFVMADPEGNEFCVIGRRMAEGT